MIFNKLSLLTSAIAASAAALPLNGTEIEGSLGKRDSYGVYACTDINFSGDCKHFFPPTNGACYALSSPYYKTISSIGPDHKVAVIMFKNSDCSDYCRGNNCDFDTIRYPGVKDLRNGYTFNDAITAISINVNPGNP